MEHTPGPWHVTNDQYSSALFGNHIGFTIKSWDGRLLRDVCNITLNNAVGIPEAERKANAQFIVRACNCHDELLEACRLTLDILDNITTDNFSKGGDKPAREALEQAIAKAKA